MRVGVQAREMHERERAVHMGNVPVPELAFIHMHAAVKYLIKGGTDALISLIFNGHTLKQCAPKLKVCKKPCVLVLGLVPFPPPFGLPSERDSLQQIVEGFGSAARGKGIRAGAVQVKLCCI